MNMEDRRFLIKPIFYISSLLFSCWLVLKIEQLCPSDLGRYESLFHSGPPVPAQSKHHTAQKRSLYSLISDLKAGRIDSVRFEEEMQKLFGRNGPPSIGEK
jgi:hypothetical protein